MATESEAADKSEANDEDSRSKGSWKLARIALLVSFWGLVVYYATTLAIPRAQYGIVFLGLAILVYVFNQFAEGSNSHIERLVLGVSGIITIVTTIYMTTEYIELITIRTGYAFWYEYIIAGAFIFVILSLVYREYGMSFLAVLLVTFAYGLFGNYAPTLIAHSGFTFERLLGIVVLELRGFYGNLNQIVAAWIAIFILFAGLVRGYGAFDLIIQISFKAADHIKSGVTQSAVIASLIIGSINGSAAANAAMTGSFTIPLMKKSGIRSETAAGIESVASSGGQIMPPIMGSSAFVMASILGMTYINVVIAGLIPALIFFVSVTVAVHYKSIEQQDAVDLKIDNHLSEVKTRRELFVEGSRYLIPVGLLVYLLGIAQWTVMTAGLYTVAATIITGGVFPILETAISEREKGAVVKAIRTAIRQTFNGFEYGAEILAPIAIIVAGINAVVTILQSTGVPAVLSLSILDLSGGILLVTTLVALVICILLGLGMPTVAAYTLVALLIAPTLSGTFGIPELSVHFFVFYGAILSGLTPPIAVAVIVASGVAESNFWKSCVEALKIASPLYVLPLTFVYSPEIVANPLSSSSLIKTGLVILGAVSMVHGFNYAGIDYGNLLLNYCTRAAFVVIGVVGMAYPGIMVRIILVVLSTCAIVLQTQHGLFHRLIGRLDV